MTTDLERFEAKYVAVPESGCWLWTGSTNGNERDPRGVFRLRGKNTRANRASWLLYKGPISGGLCVLHTCDVGLCVNPAHLYLGTHMQNAHDCHVRGRRPPAWNKGKRKQHV